MRVSKIAANARRTAPSLALRPNAVHSRPPSPAEDEHPQSVAVFPTDLGWMAMAGYGDVVQWLTLGHPSAAAAMAQVPSPWCEAVADTWKSDLVRRLQDFARGERDEFLDIAIDVGAQTAFQARVTACCRRIGWGSMLTYAELAEQAGNPGAARAVGNCMASNRIPLIVPCHRVVGSSGGLGGYSAAGGTALKRRLLALEKGQPVLTAR